MEARIDILEREVNAIKSEIAVIKSSDWAREDARILDGRVCRVEADIALLLADVAALKVDVAQLKADVAQVRIEMAQMEGRLKAWMITLTISTITVMSGIQFALYNALKH